VEDELLQVTRVRNSNEMISTTSLSAPDTPRPLFEDCNINVVTAVRFASLVAVNGTSLPTVIPSTIWGPSLHKQYPDSFRNSCKELLLCSQASAYQPSQPVPIVENHINVAAQLPKSIWIEILSYTHRDWFERPQSEAEILRRRLEMEQHAVRRANDACRDAELRRRAMERERDGYRRLALRTHARLQATIEERGGSVPALNETEDMVTGDETSQILSLFSRSRLEISFSELNAFVRRFQPDMNDDNDDDDDGDDAIEEDEDDDSTDDHANHTEAEAETFESMLMSHSDDTSEDDASSVVSLVPTSVSASLDSSSSQMLLSR
jgi:hypothetical protein